MKIKTPVLLLCIAFFAAFTAKAANVIEINKSAQHTFVQPTIQLKSINGDPKLCEPFYRYLATCGWFRVVNGQADYTEFQKGFDAMNSGMSGKVVLDWTTKKED